MPGILLMTLCIILLNFTIGTNLIYILIIRRQAGVIKVAQLIYDRGSNTENCF